MRVTNSMVTASTLSDLNKTLGRLQKSQTELSTGKTIRSMSDDPTRAATAMTLRQQLRRHEQHTRSLDNADSWLATADTALVSGLELLGRVRETSVRAGNLGVLDAASRNALADEIASMKAEMVSIANTKYLDRSIFGGTAAGDAYDSAGAFLGNEDVVNRQIATGTTVPVNVAATSIFGDDATGLFSVLDDLEASIRAGDASALTTAQSDLATATSRFSAATADVGSRSARIESVRERATIAAEDLRESLSKVEDADIAEALIRVKANENAYTAALQAAAKVIPPSLIDFMR